MIISIVQIILTKPDAVSFDLQIRETQHLKNLLHLQTPVQLMNTIQWSLHDASRSIKLVTTSCKQNEEKTSPSAVIFFDAIAIT